MIHVQQFTFNPIQVNTYVLSTPKGEGVIIDCGCSNSSEWSILQSYITSEHIHICHILNTHLHFDHVLGNRFAIDTYQLYPEANPKDYPLYQSIHTQISMFFGEQYASKMDLSYIDLLGDPLKEGDEISFGDESLKVIETPGHSPGSICFYSLSNKFLISGDTLFHGSVGRVDLPGGNWTDLISSLKRLSTLPNDTILYPGHDSKSQMGVEKLFNPYLSL